MAVPLLMALRENPGSDEVKGLGVGVLACLAVGGAMYGLFRGHLKGAGEREGIAITTLGWIVRLEIFTVLALLAPTTWRK